MFGVLYAASPEVFPEKRRGTGGNREPHFWCPGASFPESSNLSPPILTTPLTATNAGAHNCIIRKH